MSRAPLVLVATLGLAAAAVPAVSQLRRPDPSTMSAYVMGIFVRGPEWTAERTPRTDSIQAGHLANIQAMAASGALIGAGPFAGNGKFRGLLIFKDIPIDSARVLVLRDPAIKSGRLMIELHRWYAPKGIGVAYAERAKLRPDKPDSMIKVHTALLMRGSRPAKLDSLASRQVQAGHMGHILDMLTDGSLLAAGPFFDDSPTRGISFFSTDSATAYRLAHDDPAVKAGHLEIEMLPWWTAWGVLPLRSGVKEMGK